MLNKKPMEFGDYGATWHPFFLFKKSFRYLILIFAIVTLNFVIPRLMPGDPLLFLFGEEVYGAAIKNPDLINALSTKYGLDRPLLDQFLIYLENLSKLDLGFSFSFGRPIAEIISERLPLTLMITIPSTLISLFIGGSLGLYLGWDHNKPSKRLISSISVILYSIPSYWMAMGAIFIFSVWLNLTPIGGAAPMESPLPKILQHMTLPVLILTLVNVAYVTIIMHGLTVEVAEEPFIITARSKGLGDLNFKVRHLLMPSLPPFLSLAAIELGFAFSGALLVEIVFSWPGMGYTLWQAVIERDYPLLQAAFTITAVIVVVANALADFASYLLDPKMRTEA